MIAEEMYCDNCENSINKHVPSFKAQDDKKHFCSGDCVISYYEIVDFEGNRPRFRGLSLNGEGYIETA